MTTREIPRRDAIDCRDAITKTKGTHFVQTFLPEIEFQIEKCSERVLITIPSLEFFEVLSFNSILFIELLGGIGDVLIALPAVQSLSRSHPDAKLTVLTFAPGGELLETDPLIHRVIYARKGEARRSVEELLADESFDLIVSDTSYDEIDRVIQDSGTPQTVTNLWRSPPPNQFVSERFLQILLSDGLITPDSIAPPRIHLFVEERQDAQETLGKISLPLVFLFPDAGMEIKRWSGTNFVYLGQELQRRYRATVVVPAGSDPGQAAQIAYAIGGDTRVWQGGTLRNLTALMADADLVVAGDTGPIRIAAGLGVPTITLFGPSWHERYGQVSPHVNLQGYPECPERSIANFTQQRCWYSGVCPYEQWSSCLEEISPARVMTEAALLLESRLDGLCLEGPNAS